MLEIILKENTWLSRSIGMTFGWGNGYVLIPADHKAFNMNLDNLSIHGGITFNEILNEENIEAHDYLNTEAIGSRMIGFDTCHMSDTLEKWPKTEVFKEAKELRKEINKLVEESE